MSRGTGANARSNRRSHFCAECGKSFRTGEELFMHAEICLLDAFELEASAVQGPGEQRNDHRAGGVRINKTSLPSSYPVEAQFIVTASNTIGDRPTTESGKREHEGRSLVNAQGMVYGQEGEDYDEESEDYEPPPELELAEQPPKKYKRVFPIGDDGKQVRPKMECPTCGLVLYRHNFSTHFRIHTGELPFQCSFCDKRFRTSSALTVHTRCHTGERPYECPKCNYCCITKRNLDRHIINNHVKKCSRTAARLARGDYTYMPRGERSTFGPFEPNQPSNFGYGEDIEEDDIYDDEDFDDEDIDEEELEEEAEMMTRQEQSFLSTGSRSGRDVSGFGNEGSAGKHSKATYEPAYKRMRSMPILDGPEGVYGEPERDQGVSSTAKVVIEKEGEGLVGQKGSKST